MEMFEHAGLPTFAQMNLLTRVEGVVTHISAPYVSCETEPLDTSNCFLTSAGLIVHYSCKYRLHYLEENTWALAYSRVKWTPHLAQSRKAEQSIAIIYPIRRWIWCARALLISHICVRYLLSLIVSCLAFAEVVDWSSCASNDFCFCFSYSKYTTWHCVLRWLTRFEVL